MKEGLSTDKFEISLFPFTFSVFAGVGSCMDTWTPIAREYNALRCGSIDGTDEYPHDKGVLRALNSKYKPNK